ncbi:hypothetical protein [Nonomuraea pusilla]|uniref:Transglutaminase-like superfamily protein n=1 Tax=Nonomuraea pusilla TaxID=46177 RepID=A0A1H7IUX9_9ACTN|nr:hypothetical protein [Nonomuraea pusilla]SEK66054.1 hypothetical protein SAMN05660976_00936 [Nonomuraea pusilla]
MNERQPASRTLALGRGSCSQRLAVLEAVARACGVATRVRGLLVDGRFWHPRFPLLRPLVPGRVVLAWPCGQTLCAPARLAADLVLSRRTPAAP